MELASNQLVVVVPDDRPSAWTSIQGLVDPKVRRIAVGYSAGVPAGVYAREDLTRIGRATLLPKVVPAGSVRLALAAVESGAVDAAVVYRTDAAVAKRSRVAWRVPHEEGPAIRYAAVAVRDAPNPAGADRLLRFLRSPEVASLMQRAGFAPPLAASRKSR